MHTVRAVLLFKLNSTSLNGESCQKGPLHCRGWTSSGLAVPSPAPATIALVAGIVFTLAPVAAQPAAEKPPVQKWEYLETSNSRWSDRGEDGWELVAVLEMEDGGFGARRFFFKRPKQ